MPTIVVQGLYAAAAVSDFDAALEWYGKLVGRPADDHPFPGMAQWRNLGTAGVQLWKDASRSGHSIMTIVVPNLSVEKARLSALGIGLENEAFGDFGAVAQVFDPDGNQINLAEPPKGFTGS